MRSSYRLSKKILIVFTFLVIVGLVELALIAWKIDNPNKHPNTVNPSQFNKSNYSYNDPASIWVVVNKGRILPSDYVPSDLIAPEIPLRTSASDSEMHLRDESAKAMETMFAAAADSGIRLRLASGYRSYAEQKIVFSNEVKNNGQKIADRESARPGYSEHQTGWAADVEPYDRTCEIDDCFAQTSEGKWLATNSYKYGFVIRYQSNNEALTGYKFEPWHVRYVGRDLAVELHNKNQTLEQFFNLPSYSSYSPKSYQLKIGA